MIPRSIERAWPAAAVLALFVLSAAGPAPQRESAPPAQGVAPCDPFSQTGSGGTSFGFNSGAGIRQPLPDGIAVASCSLRVAGTGWCSANVRVVEWDPLALAPDPLSVALRTAFCDPSRMNYYTTNAVPRITFVPPIVTQSLPGVADPPRMQVAFEVSAAPSGLNYPFVGDYAPQGDAGMPAAVTFGGLPALTGPHPVAAYALCDGGGTLADLRVLQGVRRTDSVAPTGQAEYLQRFRVPEAVEAQWVELAMDPPPGDWGPTLVLALADVTGLPDPPAQLPSPLAQALLQTFFYWQPGPRWCTSLDFDHLVTLLPGREYALVLQSASGYVYRTHALTATEDAKFTYGIGAFHCRALATDSWAPVTGQALSFKLVGRSQGSPLSVAPRAGFLLGVTPNPAHATPEVTWSGATGPVRLEVFDARGRRVASGGGGAAGRWLVTAREAQPLGAGVYFVRARDSEGARADERLVVVR